MGWQGGGVGGLGWNMSAGLEERFLGNSSEWVENARVFGGLDVVGIIVMKGQGRGVIRSGLSWKEMSSCVHLDRRAVDFGWRLSG